MYCDECGRDAVIVYTDEGRDICIRCLRRLHPEQAPTVDQEAIAKRVMEKKRLRMIDLPGFAEWSAQYGGIDRLLPESHKHYVLVHPDELTKSLVWLFERECQGYFDMLTGDCGFPQRHLHDYKVANQKTGKN